MPVPSGFDTKVRLVSNTPIAASDLNTEISTQNGAGYTMIDLKFLDDDNAFLTFIRAGDPPLDAVTPQKIKLVAANQAALDLDNATEQALGYYPLVTYTTPAGLLFVQYVDYGSGS